MTARTATAAVAAGLTLAVLSSCVRPPDSPDSLPPPNNLPATTPATPSAYPTAVQSGLTPTAPSPTLTLPTPHQSPPANTPTPAPNPIPQPPTSTQLNAALLTRADLPGYSLSNEPDLNGTTTCADLNVDYTAGASVSVTVLFAKTSLGPYLRETLLVTSTTHADTILQDLANAPTCGTFSGTVPGVGPATFTVSRADVGSYGNTTTAVQITIEPANHLATIVETLVAIRYQSVLMVLTHTAVTGHDDALTATATARAYDKLQRVG